MLDQAIKLRRLVEERARHGPHEVAARPRRVVVGSGKGGVGTTTMAVNLAAVLAEGGLRTVLVDADPAGGEAARLCGFSERHTLAEVLSGRGQLAEVVQPGPAGMRLLPGAWGLGRLSDYPAAAADRLLDGLTRIEPPADVVLLDAGNSPHRVTRRLWRAADMLVVLSTPETAAILDAYAAIKLAVADGCVAQLYCAVNFAATPGAGEEVHRRLARACRRFLGVELRCLGEVARDGMVSAAGAAGQPLVLAASRCSAAVQLAEIGRRLAAALGGPALASKKQKADSTSTALLADY
jgi:flagellar biosynthesis protein FlhG